MTKTSPSFAAVTPFRLRHRREALGLTQEGLAGLVGVTPNTVARWERGERKSRIPGAVDALLTQLEERKQAATGSAPTPEAPVNQAPPAAPQQQPTVQERPSAKRIVSSSSKSLPAGPTRKGRSKTTSKPASSRRPRGGGRAATAARRRKSSS